MSQDRRSSIHCGDGDSPILSSAQHQQHQVAGSREVQIPRGIPLPGMVQPSRSIPHSSPSHGFVNPLGPTGLVGPIGSNIGTQHQACGSPGMSRSSLATTGIPIRPPGLHQGTKLSPLYMFSICTCSNPRGVVWSNDMGISMQTCRSSRTSFLRQSISIKLNMKQCTK